jgi:hypothetical protein
MTSSIEPPYPRQGRVKIQISKSKCQMNVKFQNGILKRVENDILFAPNQVLNLAQDQGILARHLNFGFDLKFEL